MSDDLELSIMLQDMIETAIKRGRITDNDYVLLSIDLLTQLGLVNDEAKTILAKNQKQNDQVRED